jgi:hypothetical protein
MKAYGERMYRSTFSWLRHYLVVSGQLYALTALPPGKDLLVATGQKAGWTPEPLWTISWSDNSWPYRDWISDPSVVQPVASRYTDSSTAALLRNIMLWIKWLSKQVSHMAGQTHTHPDIATDISMWSSGQSSCLYPEARVRFPALPEKKSSGSGTGSTQPREYNWGATW